MDMQQFSKPDVGFRYILTMTDVLSKRACTIGLKKRTGHQVSQAFKTVFDARCISEKLQTS